jgi:hypothetical protein
LYASYIPSVAFSPLISRGPTIKDLLMIISASSSLTNGPLALITIDVVLDLIYIPSEETSSIS